MRGRTVVAIAHRLSTVRNFDRIVVLQFDRVIQDGPPDLLLRRERLYRRLVQRVVSPIRRRRRYCPRCTGNSANLGKLLT
jgi:ATP-binding cassette subfamily B protein